MQLFNWQDFAKRDSERIIHVKWGREQEIDVRGQEELIRV